LYPNIGIFIAVIISEMLDHFTRYQNNSTSSSWNEFDEQEVIEHEVIATAEIDIVNVTDLMREFQSLKVELQFLRKEYVSLTSKNKELSLNFPIKNVLAVSKTIIRNKIHFHVQPQEIEFISPREQIKVHPNSPSESIGIAQVQCVKSVYGLSEIEVESFKVLKVKEVISPVFNEVVRLADESVIEDNSTGNVEVNKCYVLDSTLNKISPDESFRKINGSTGVKVWNKYDVSGNLVSGFNQSMVYGVSDEFIYHKTHMSRLIVIFIDIIAGLIFNWFIVFQNCRTSTILRKAVRCNVRFS
jgi:hypothetical protein